MKTWIKRTIIGTLIGVTTIVVAGYIVLDVVFSDMCGNEINIELVSPDNKHKAIIYQRDCGATTGFSTQISIIKRNEKLPNKNGNVLTSAGHPSDNDYKLKWLGAEKLLISNTHGNHIYFKENKIGIISISYEYHAEFS